MFAEGVNIKYDGNEDCCGLKRKLNVVSEVCGYTKDLPRHFETWWWNKDVDVAMPRERELFSIWKQSRNEEDKKKHCEAKNDCMFLSRYVRVSEGIHTLLYSCLNVKKHFAPSRCEI